MAYPSGGGLVSVTSGAGQPADKRSIRSRSIGRSLAIRSHWCGMSQGLAREHGTDHAEARQPSSNFVAVTSGSIARLAAVSLDCADRNGWRTSAWPARWSTVVGERLERGARRVRRCAGDAAGRGATRRPCGREARSSTWTSPLMTSKPLQRELRAVLSAAAQEYGKRQFCAVRSPASGRRSHQACDSAQGSACCRREERISPASHTREQSRRRHRGPHLAAGPAGTDRRG